MNYENFKQGFNKPTIITAQQYGTKVSVEIDHSDTDIDELFDAFQTLVVGLGYHESAWKQWIIDRADEYREEDEEETGKDMGTYEPTAELKKAVEDFVANLPKVNYEEEDSFFGPYDSDEKRMDIIGQNGNEGLHYRATDEDESEFDDYGMRIAKDKVGFEWGDEPEEDYDGQFDDWKNETPEDDNLFEGDEWKANENLKAANERYKKEVKKMNLKQKRNSKK